MMNLIRPSVFVGKNQTRNCRQVYFMRDRCIHGTKEVLSSEEKKSDTKEDSSLVDDMSEPTNCCMSGCANCVWIEYAEKLSATIAKSDADVQKMILDKVQDPNMRAFLSMELKFRNIIKD
nr:PREDICTED: oxidoreductase-like domain-containing protein 1 [Megachile rotundata]XP_012152625.1 PREDICTED: oxidoreductase-like domain-containing protein 1 [Megachile rotundata]XP_012152626.1 PREDICTED: oxidoreductase-like domain-containing protein 1 [Megachile rotundata]